MINKVRDSGRPSLTPISRRGESDAELMRRMQTGDLAPLGILYDRYHAQVRQFLLRATSGASYVDDLAQDTFLTLMNTAPRFDGRESARPFLIGIAAQLVRRRKRGLLRWARAVSGLSSVSPDAMHRTPEVLAGDLEELRRFEQALAALSEEKRLVFLMIEREGLSGEEVAQALEIPVNTVWTRLHYARSELRRAVVREDA